MHQGEWMSPVTLLDERRDSIVWIGLASCAGALTTVAPLAVSLVVSVVSTLFVRGGQKLVALLSLLAFAVGSARAHARIDEHETERREVIAAGAWPARSAVTGRVSRAPIVIGGSLRIELDDALVHRFDDDVTLRGRVVLHLKIDEDSEGLVVARGDEISAFASLAPPYRFWNDGAGDPRPRAARRKVVLSGSADDVQVVRVVGGIAWAIDRARAHVRARIVSTFPLETEAMARALVLGEDDLPEEDQRAFRRSGLAHLLAVSGMHLVLVVMSLVAGLRAVLVRVPRLAARGDVTRLASLVGLPVAWLYAEFAGGSGSAVRAAWMCTFVLLARVLARRATSLRGLGWSLVAMSVLDPLVAFDVSFVLSALATAGLIALSRPIERAIRRVRLFGRSLPSFVAKPFAATTAATIACSPVLATMAPEIPLSGLVANVVAVPLGEAAALPLCLLHALLGFWPAAEIGAAWTASGALLLVRVVARTFTWGALPVPAPTAEQLAAIACVAAGMTLGRPRPWAVAGAFALVVLELSVIRNGSPRGVLRATFIDVGQGDAALIDFPDGSAMLVDGGGLVGSPIDVGERAVGALLAARRRKALETVVLSHPHPDHYLGLSSALARVEVGAFWDNGQAEEEGASGPYAALLSELRGRGVPVLRPRDLCGARSMGGAVVEVLAPCPGPDLDRSANDNSFVMRIRFGGRAVLLVGDAEREEESELVLQHGARGGLRADVLKVGHHGSRSSSSPAFLEAVAPRVAVVSCGVRNRFGHPHAVTLEALSRSGAEILRTDHVGSVVVETDGRSLDVRTMTEARPPSSPPAKDGEEGGQLRSTTPM